MVPENGLDEIQHKHEIKLELAVECMFLLQAYFMDIGLTSFPMFEKWKKHELICYTMYLTNHVKWTKPLFYSCPFIYLPL